jgi:hypothetical protein
MDALMIEFEWFFAARLSEADRSLLTKKLEPSILRWCGIMIGPLLAELERNQDRQAALRLQASRTRERISGEPIEVLLALILTRSSLPLCSIYVGPYAYVRKQVILTKRLLEAQLSRPGIKATVIEFS